MLPFPRQANAAFAAAGVSNASARALDCAQLLAVEDLKGKFDWVFTFDAIHDQVAERVVGREFKC